MKIFALFLEYGKISTFRLFNKIMDNVHFSNGCPSVQSPKIDNLWNSQILTNLNSSWKNSEQFWATFVKNGSEFLQIFENRCRDVQNRWFWLLSWRIQIGKNLRIPKMVKFLKIKQFLAIWQSFEHEQFFSKHFYSITHMKVGNPFIFVKLL